MFLYAGGCLKRLNKPKECGIFPRFPYGGTNRIRFKGYNLSRMAPPSKILVNLGAKISNFFTNSTTLSQFGAENGTFWHKTSALPQLWCGKWHFLAQNISTSITLVREIALFGTKPQYFHNFGPANTPFGHQTTATPQLWCGKWHFLAQKLSTFTTLVPQIPLLGTKPQQPHNFGPANGTFGHQTSVLPQLWCGK